MPLKILISGATGFVGSNLVRRLTADNLEIHLLTRTNSNLWRIADIVDKTTNHTVNLLEKDRLNHIVSLIQPDYVFHLANAGLYGGVSVSDQDLAETNFIGLINLISALEKIDYKKFINFGSSSEYGLKKGPMKETEACFPVNAYGLTKLTATLYAKLIAETQNKPIVTLRLFSPFGPYDDHRRLISRVILDLLLGREINLGDPNVVRDYVFIDDVIDLLIETISGTTNFNGEIFNVGSGHESKIINVVNLIVQSINPKTEIKWHQNPNQSRESQRWEADTAKIFDNFKWRPKHSLEEGIKKTIDWFKRNKNLYNQFFPSRS